MLLTKKARLIAVFSAFVILIGVTPTTAATITAIETGNWNSTSTWDGGTIPGSGDDVIITAPYTVSVTDERMANSVTIQNGDDAFLSILSVSSGGVLTISGDLYIVSDMDAASARLDLSGTIVINGNIDFTSYNAPDVRIRMLNGGALTLNGIINNITSGNITSGAGAVSTFTFAGSATQTIPTGSGYSYHNLAINKSGSNTATINAAITSSKVRENLTVVEGRFGNGGFAIAGAVGKTFSVENGGSFILSGTSALPTTFTHSFQTGSTIIYDGTNTIVNPNSGNFQNVTIQTAGTKVLGGNITINGNLTITGGTLDVTATPYNIDLKGNWNNTGGTFTARTGTVTFSGTTSQSISTNAQNFYNLTFNNTLAGLSAITLSSDVSVSNVCTMTDGIINTGSNILILTSTTAANLTGYSSACYVNGNLRRSITNNTSIYALPVGSSAYQLVELKNNNMTTTTQLDAKFGTLVNHDDDDLVACDGALCYQSLSIAGMWTIDANANPGSGSYDIYAYIGNMSGAVDNEFAVVKRPTGSTSGADWVAEAAGTINSDNGDGRLASHGYALRMGLTSFSEFGIGREQSGSSLPITLVDFSARYNKSGIVNITWTTATEINNDYFTVERSSNGVNFEPLAEIDGAGNSTKLTPYTVVDNNPIKGIGYYRLKQTDYDGTSTYSRIVSVNAVNTALPRNFVIFPNPVASGGLLSINQTGGDGFTPSSMEYEVEFFNALTGQKIHSQTLSFVNMQITEQFSPGVYFVKITENGTEYHHKMIVQ